MPKTSDIDDFDAALKGDERAQMRHIIRTLSTHMTCLAIFVSQEGLRQSAVELSKSALEFLDADRP